MNVKELTNEEVAMYLRIIRVMGLFPDRFEKELLDEAADRIMLFEEVTKNVKRN